MTEGYQRVLAAHPYYISCIKLWLPPAARLARAQTPLPDAVAHAVHLLEDGALDQARRVIAAADKLLRQTGLGDLADALASLAAIYEKNHDEAVYFAGQAIAAQPGCAEYHYLRGIAAAQMRDIPVCVEACQHALAIDPSLALAAAALAIIATLDHDWQEALTMARRAKQGGNFNLHLIDLCLLAACWRLGIPNESPFILDALNGEQIAGVEWLPNVEWPEIAKARYNFFVYCDFSYLLEHAIPLVWSLAVTRPTNTHIHLHIANPRNAAPAIIEEIRKRSGLSISWSEERADPFRYGNLRVYHSSARFCRFAEFLKRTRSAAYMLDADALFRKKPEEMEIFGNEDADLALQYAPDNPLWEICTGAGLFARPTSGTIRYLDIVSRFIVDNLHQGRGRWFLDQIALSLAYERMANSLKCITLPITIYADQSFRDASAIWTVGLEKNADDKYNAYKRDLIRRFGDLGDIANIATGPNTALAMSILGPMLVNRHDMYIGPQIATHGIWAGGELDLLRHFIKSDDTVIDVGANVGMHSLAFANWVGPKGAVHAFEPQQELYELLKRNMEINAWPQVNCHLGAVGKSQGMIHVPAVDYGKPNNFGALSLKTDASPHNEIIVDRSKGYEVSQITLDSLNLDTCRLIKIDAEGMEADVLEGAGVLLDKCRPVLYVEFHSRKKTLATFLKQKNYRIYLHDTPGNPNILALPAGLNVKTGLPELTDISALTD